MSNQHGPKADTERGFISSRKESRSCSTVVIQYTFHITRVAKSEKIFDHNGGPNRKINKHANANQNQIRNKSKATGS